MQPQASGQTVKANQPIGRTPAPSAGPSIEAPIPVLVHLSGSRRGVTKRLVEQTVRIGTAANAEIHFPADREPSVSPRHATLQRRDGAYELRTERNQAVWLNGKQVNSARLNPGDVLQIGQGGPLMRFRCARSVVPAYKSMAEALADCVDCARYGAQKPLQRAAIFLSATPRELATQTSPWFRWGVAVFLVLLTVTTTALTVHSMHLEKRLQAEQLRVSSIAKLLPRGDNALLTADDLEAAHSQMETRFSNAMERIGALEARLAAVRSIISTAAQSIVLLQGAYGFIETASGKPLRYAGIGPDGNPLRNAAGEPFVTTEGNGPIVENLFTGTAFVATDDGLLLTNRHVAMPWEVDEAAQLIAKQELRPVLRRLLGYLPSIKEPFEVKLLAASDQADVAVLRCSAVTGRIRPLNLSAVPAQPGDEVIVIGYPAGIRALLARSDKAFIEKLKTERDTDFWTVAQRLSSEGRISPLATRGIVGQISAAAVVYDAETTSGGSGGPVLNLDGEIVAINTGIMREFGGSNLGVPSEQVRKLLASTRARSP